MGVASSVSSKLSSFVNTYLSSFVEGVSPAHISASLLRGSLSLRNVKLKNRLLEDGLAVVLPLRSRHMFFKSLQIEYSLTRKKLKVTLAEGTCILESRRHHEWSKEFHLLRDGGIKASYLQAYKDEEKLLLNGFEGLFPVPSWLLPDVEVAILDTVIRVEDFATDAHDPWVISVSVDKLFLGDPCYTKDLRDENTKSRNFLRTILDNNAKLFAVEFWFRGVAIVVEQVLAGGGGATSTAWHLANGSSAEGASDDSRRSSSSGDSSGGNGSGDRLSSAAEDDHHGSATSSAASSIGKQSYHMTLIDPAMAGKCMMEKLYVYPGPNLAEELPRDWPVNKRGIITRIEGNLARVQWFDAETGEKVRSMESDALEDWYAEHITQESFLNADGTLTDEYFAARDAARKAGEGAEGGSFLGLFGFPK
eukprot:g5150.t1